MVVPLSNWPKELSPQARMVSAATTAVGVRWAPAGSTPAAWVTVTRQREAESPGQRTGRPTRASPLKIPRTNSRHRAHL